MNKTKKIIFTMIFIFLAIIAINTNVKAVSASLSASSRDVTVGTQVTITTSIYGAAWQVNLSGAVSTAYAGYTDNAEDQTITRQTSFTPSSAGTYTVNLSGNVTGSNDPGSTQVSDSVTINVREQESSSSSSSSSGSDASTSTHTSSDTSTASTKSKNANLSNLGITPNDFSGFKPGTTSYSVTVPNDVEQVTVYANLQDSKASLTGTGVQKLNVGQNALNVVVTAEDGTKKTYTINVTREEAEDSDENSEEEETTVEEGTSNPSNSDLLKLEVTGYTLTPEFSPDIYEYTLDINGDISDLDVVTEGANHNVNIEVSGNTNLQEGENVITILVYNEETQATTTYQIIVNKINVDLEGVNTTLNDAVNRANTIRYIIVGVVILIIIGIIAYADLIQNKSNNLPSSIEYKMNNNIDDDYEYDEEDKERLNLDEEEGFFSRINREVSEEPEEEKTKTTTIANSIIEDIPEESNANTLEKPKSVNNDEEMEEEEDFFRTTRSKKKGKHF